MKKSTNGKNKMDLLGSFYEINNKKIKRSINIEESLYIRIMRIAETKFDTTLSEFVNSAIEHYKTRSEPTALPPPLKAPVTYRTIRVRESNYAYVCKLHDEFGISITRVINDAIRVFLDAIDRAEREEKNHRK